MIENPITQANLKMLKIANFEIIDTQTKELACKSIGDGAMAEPQEIFWQSAKILLQNEFWKDRMVIVTGGGTIEKIDDVRFISNFSSGKMASSLATALYCMGADVNLISTRFENNIPLDIHTIDVESSNDMFEYLTASLRVAKKGKLSKASLLKDEAIHLIQKKPYLFMVAAVSDYIPKFPQNGKIKKDILGDNFELSLTKNIDILDSINKDGIVTVGFKAEMDENNGEKNASKIIDSKNIDAVCLNILKDSSSFGTDTNSIEFISANKKETIPNADKLTVSFEILNHAKSI
jgi:phosphopantothenoylcysteine decarboxylase/phosphopantothenate--cysteine ligase